MHEARGVLTVDLDDAPTIEITAVRPESSTESTFVELLADVMGVERVSADSNFFDDLGADSMVMARFCARVRKRPDLPSVSMKDIYQHRTIRSLATALADDAPVPLGGDAPVPLESTFAEVLADVMQIERVSVDSNFFDDLGADSMVMARFCARVRKRPDLPSVSMKDIYQHRTIRSLATALAGDAPVALGGDAPVPLESTFAEVLADVMQVERVSVDSNFFDDLGADSMVMARFCARVRKRPELPVGIDEGHLPTPHDQKPGHGTRGRGSCSGRVAGSDLCRVARSDLCRVARSDLGRGGETGEDAAGHPLRGATAPDLPRIWLSRRAAHRSRLRVDFGGLRCA